MEGIFMYVFVIMCVSSVTSFSSQDVCRDVEVMTNFNTASYLGRWYQWGKIPNAIEIPGSCFTATYSPKDGLGFSWDNRWYDENSEKYLTMSDTARLVGDSGEAKILVSLPVLSLEVNYWVLATDYKNYAVIYGCNAINDKTYVTSWVLTRQPAMTPEILAEVYIVITKNNLDPSAYVLIRQDADCVYA